MAEMFPHFYCDTCSNVFFDEAHRDRVAGAEDGEVVLESLAPALFQPKKR